LIYYVKTYTDYPPVILCACGANLEREMLEKSYVADKSGILSNYYTHFVGPPYTYIHIIIDCSLHYNIPGFLPGFCVLFVSFQMLGELLD
jgi:hypothetical protein